MDDHPTPAELEGFVWNQLSAERFRAVAAHLARGCEECQAVTGRAFGAFLGKVEPPEAPMTAAKEVEYDAALDRAFAAALRKKRKVFEDRKREALALLADPTLETLPEVPKHLRGLPLFEALLERSWSLRHDDPDQMVQLASWALLLAERLPTWPPGDPHVMDCRCRAWIELGNAHRVADNLDEADHALGWAAQMFIQGTQDEALAARMFDVQASLYGSQRLFDLAAAALEVVLRIHQRRGDDHLTGRAFVSKGIYAGYQGRAEEAVRLITEGLPLLDAVRDPQLVFAATHNKARFLMDCGRYREARIELFPLYKLGGSGGRVNELKVRWLEGQIHAGLDRLDLAERNLRDVHQGFEAMGLGYKAALAGLELGAVLLRLGRMDEACEEVLEAAGVFLAIGIGREAGASLLLLRTACESKVADPILLDEVIHRLRGLEGSPKNPEPPAVE